MLNLNRQFLLRRPWWWERLMAGGEGDDRGWDGWMVSPTQWPRVWVNSGSWWRTGRPGVLQFMGSQRVGHDWATEQNLALLVVTLVIIMTIFSSITWDNVEKLDRRGSGKGRRVPPGASWVKRRNKRKCNTGNPQVTGKSDLWKAEGLCLLKAQNAQQTLSSRERGQGGKQPALLPFLQASVARSFPHRESSGRGTGWKLSA